MRSLALDLGTKTGFAYYDHPADKGKINPEKSGMRPFGNYKERGERYKRFLKMLDGIKPNVIFFEIVKQHAGTLAAHVYGGYMATMELYCHIHHVPYFPLHVGTIKKHATGKGNATKDMMIAAAREKLGFTGSDDNQADALWMLDLGLRHHSTVEMKGV